MAKITGATPSDGTDDVHVDMHLLEYLVLEDLTFDADLDTEPKPWFIPPEGWTTLFDALVNAGIPTTEAKDKEEAKSIFSSYITDLPEDQKTLAHADVVIADDDTGTWLDYVWPAKLRQSDESIAIYLQLRQILAGIWTEEGRDDEPYAWHLDPTSAPEAGRPATQLSSGYNVERQIMLHKYQLFAATQAPHLWASIASTTARESPSS